MSFTACCGHEGCVALREGSGFADHFSARVRGCVSSLRRKGEPVKERGLWPGGVDVPGRGNAINDQPPSVRSGHSGAVSKEVAGADASERSSALGTEAGSEV